MKIIIFSSPAVTAQVNEWLANNPTIKVIGLAQSEYDGTMHLTLLYQGEATTASAVSQSVLPTAASPV